jgi:hypothetical protein
VPTRKLKTWKSFVWTARQVYEVERDSDAVYEAMAEWMALIGSVRMAEKKARMAEQTRNADSSTGDLSDEEEAKND